MTKEYKETDDSKQLEAAKWVGPRIRELCDRKNITKYRLSQMTGISQTVLGNIIKGKSVPSIHTLDRICTALDISLAQFFARDKVPDLTTEQQELVETWIWLNENDRNKLMKIVHIFQEKE
ncbi:MAG: helix-turn-helix transcriptional regulator [Clostridiales bacterium]|nr:helix-turn-helix transcriptional regulator [Clostridiales bacterium]